MVPERLPPRGAILHVLMFSDDQGHFLLIILLNSAPPVWTIMRRPSCGVNVTVVTRGVLSSTCCWVQPPSGSLNTWQKSTPSWRTGPSIYLRRPYFCSVTGRFTCSTFRRWTSVQGPTWTACSAQRNFSCCLCLMYLGWSTVLLMIFWRWCNISFSTFWHIMSQWPLFINVIMT